MPNLSPLLLFVFLSVVPIGVSPEHTESGRQQVHISLAGNDHMRITWITSDMNAPSVVHYRNSPGNEVTVIGESSSYRYLSYSSGAIHHVKIGPLEAGTIYHYRCGDSDEEFTFRTPPASFPVEFAVAGDLGQTDWTCSTLSHIGARNYDVLLLGGDLSYADTYQPLWDSFGRLVEPYAAARPWMVTQGNHDIESIPIVHPHRFTAYNSRWLMPYLESGSMSNLYYSFDVFGAHIIMLGSYVEFQRGSYQYTWLVDDLAGVDRKRTPWLFVVFHTPWYSSNNAHRGDGENMRRAMEELLYEARVDAVFAGHVHAYERFTRVYENEANTCGIVHVTIGDGGNREGLARSFKNPRPMISMFREASFGNGWLRLLNETHAHWAWYRNNETVGMISDEVWLRSMSLSEICNTSSVSSLESMKDEL